MRKVLTSLILSFLIGNVAAAVETVAEVDLQRYMGKWFEIASIPARFQKKCVKNVTAVYAIQKNGKVKVTNSCVKSNGHLEVANGLAQVKNKETNAELGVSFVPFLNRFGWFEGQYKILYLDSEYQYVLVGEDKNKYGWILSRTPTLPAEVLIMLEREIVRQGYNSCEFLTTVQDGGSYSSGEELCRVIKN